MSDETSSTLLRWTAREKAEDMLCRLRTLAQTLQELHVELVESTILSCVPKRTDNIL
jgi:hypothetical protein